jgi:hypothetical protein
MGPLSSDPPASDDLIHRRFARILAALSVIVIVAAAVTAWMLTRSDGTEYHAHGVTFRYPSTWRIADTAWTGPIADMQTFSVRVTAWDPDNSISVGAVDGVSSAPGSVEQNAEDMATLLFSDGAEWSDEYPRKVTFHGYLTYLMVSRTVSDVESPIAHRTTVVFKGGLAYAIDCTTNGLYESAVNEACEQILDSFRIDVSEPPAPM